jgi:hypothetical protein
MPSWTPGPVDSPTPAPTPTGRSGTFTTLGDLGFLCAPPPFLVLLGDGTVLAADCGPDPLQLIDPVTGANYRVGPPQPADDVVAANLLGNGTVLLVGSEGDARIYDPATKTVTPTAQSLVDPQIGVAVSLRDGRALLIGGLLDATGEKIPAAEVYDPATGKFSLTGSMKTAREWPNATLLQDGKVLVSGGNAPDGGSQLIGRAEIYDPATGQFSNTGSMLTNRVGNSATLLGDGRILFAGGEREPGDFTSRLKSVEIFDPKTGRFSKTGSTQTGHDSPVAVRLKDGRVLLIGGGGETPSTELYDQKTGRFEASGPLVGGVDFSADAGLLLQDGRVLVIASDMTTDAWPAIEIYWP